MSIEYSFLKLAPKLRLGAHLFRKLCLISNILLCSFPIRRGGPVWEGPFLSKELLPNQVRCGFGRSTKDYKKNFDLALLCDFVPPRRICGKWDYTKKKRNRKFRFIFNEFVLLFMTTNQIIPIQKYSYLRTYL